LHRKSGHQGLFGAKPGDNALARGFSMPGSRCSPRHDQTPLIRQTVEVELLTVRPFDLAEACEAAHWAYEPPFDLYDSDPAKPELFLEIDGDGLGYYALSSPTDGVVGFCCFGAQARVRPQRAEEGTLDLGAGIRPTRLSEGVGTRALPLILEFANDHWSPQNFRVAIASFNERSLRLCQSAGFTRVGSFRNHQRRAFLELMRDATLTIAGEV
jgi:[ribosomal protein S18]-alanine N-acetyltransferase